MQKQSTITQIQKKKATDYSVSRMSVTKKVKGYRQLRPAAENNPIPVFDDERVLATILKYFAYKDQVYDLLQKVNKHTRAYLKGAIGGVLRKSLVLYRWHPYSSLPEKLKETDLTRDDKMKEKDKDEWRVKEDTYFSSTRAMVKPQAKESFMPKMITAVWNEKKIKSKEQLM